MNGYKRFEKVDVEVGTSCKKEISVRVPPETQMKKLKIKKIVAWENNKSIRKKNDVEKCLWDWEKKYVKWKKNESIMRW